MGSDSLERQPACDVFDDYATRHPRTSAGGPVATLNQYHCFGGSLSSDLEFPDLVQSNMPAPTWTLRIGHGGEPDNGPRRLQGVFESEWSPVRMYECQGGTEIECPALGTFRVSADGAIMTWWPAVGAPMEVVRAFILGPLFGLALRARKLLCLHASAVVVSGSAIAFIGPKGFGKSTLALAMVVRGNQLLTDDMLAIMPGRPTLAIPGVPSARVWPDSLEALNLENVEHRVVPGIKQTLTNFPGTILGEQFLPLKAIYILDPVTAMPPGKAFVRTRLRGARAVIAVAQHRRLPDSLLGLDNAAIELEWVAATARSVPVFKLSLTRLLGDIVEVAGGMNAWHRESRRYRPPGRAKRIVIPPGMSG